jgi:hypothetical protein
VLIRFAGVMVVILMPGLGTGTEMRVEVDANLVTALDTSASVGRYEEWVEREGLASALAHPRFLAAVRTGPHRRIGFAVLMWSSHGHTKMLVPWTTIATPEDAAQISGHLRSSHLIEEAQLLDRDIPTDHYEAPTGHHQTDIALAIRSASALLGSAPTSSRRSVINIVGNGPSNSGTEPTQARDAALEAGQVINGLVVGYGLAGDVEYYRTHVIGGPGSFVMQTSSPQEVAEAFLAKFRLDIAGLSEATSFDQRFLTAHRMSDPPDP